MGRSYLTEEQARDADYAFQSELDAHTTNSGIHADVTISGTVDHLLLANVGTNTHATIDTHIADFDIHFPWSDVETVSGTLSSEIDSDISTHAGLPDAHHSRSHAITSTTDHTGGNWKVLYSDGSGDWQELAISTSGTVLKSQGTNVAPVWDEDQSCQVSKYVTTISVWTPSGDLYYADVTHSLDTKDVVVEAYTTADDKTVGLEAIDRTDDDTIRIWSCTNTEDVRVVVLSTNTGVAFTAHSIQSHTDTSATGAQLDELVGGGATTLHGHIVADITDAGNAAYRNVGQISGSVPKVGTAGLNNDEIVLTNSAGNLITIASGTAFNKNFGTGATQVAQGDHSHAQLHDRSHAITSTDDHTAGNWKVLYSDGSGDVQELALGADGDSLVSNGPSTAPSWTTISGGAGSGDVTSASSITDHAVVRGDGGAKGIQDSGWFIADDDKMTATFGTAENTFMMTLQNSTASGEFIHLKDSSGNSTIQMRSGGGGQGILNLFMEDGSTKYFEAIDGTVKVGRKPNAVDTAWEFIVDGSTTGSGVLFRVGENQGDIAFRIVDADESFHLLDVHADNGEFVFGTTYSGTLAANGSVYGIDNQHPTSNADAADINTQFGVYRIGGQPCMMTTYFENAASESQSDTTSTSYVVKLTHTTPSLPLGTYRIGWSYEISVDTNGIVVTQEVKVGSTVVAEPSFEADSDWHNHGGFYYYTDLSGATTITISHKSNGTNNSQIRRARLEIWRVS